MVENEQVQRNVLKSGKVDTIISEPIGVMLLHERMVRLGQPLRRRADGHESADPADYRSNRSSSPETCS